VTKDGTLRWGILGPGGIAHAFTADLIQNGLIVQAVGSRQLIKAQEFADEFDIANAHGSYEDLVADPDVDVIYIATPHPFHADNALLALNAGKHVLVEKPFTLNQAEAERVVARADELGLVVLEAMWTRFLPHMVRLREILAEGLLGELVGVVADHTQSLPQNPEHRINNLELGGGALLDLGIYPVSFTVDVLGIPDTIQASAAFAETGADSTVATVFGYEGGRTATSFSTSTAKGTNVASVLGTRGRIDLDAVWYSPTTFRRYDADGELQETYTSTVVGRGMHYQALELERLVAEGHLSGAILPTSETIAIMGVLDEVRRQIGLVYPGERNTAV
jgi:predicted dehydrogenase